MSKDKIENLCPLTSEEEDLVRDEESKCKTSWDQSHSNRNAYNALKEKIHAFLRGEQEGVCCYCKKRLSYETNEMHIEHIISKHNNPLFTYHLKNLSLACRNCNCSKGSAVVYLNEDAEKKLRRYPLGSTNLLIPHPHFDNYSEFIEFAYGFYPIPVENNIKGVNLISMCKLDRSGVIMRRVEEERIDGVELSIREQLRSLRTTEKSKLDDKIAEIINELFDFYEVD